MGKIVEVVSTKMEEDISSASASVNAYKEYMDSVDYIQAYSPVPVVFKIISALFFIIVYGITIGQVYKGESVIRSGLILMILFVTAFVFIIWFLNIVTRVLVKSKWGDPKECVAVVQKVVDSGVSYDTKGAGKLVLMYIPTLDKFIHYETNSSKDCNFKPDEKYNIIVSDKFKLWDFVKK